MDCDWLGWAGGGGRNYRKRKTFSDSAEEWARLFCEIGQVLESPPKLRFPVFVTDAVKAVKQRHKQNDLAAALKYGVIHGAEPFQAKRISIGTRAAINEHY